jgi:hypothetical protein
MPYEVRLDAENQLLRVEFTSDSTVENWKSALGQVERLSEETGICRVLIDVRRQTDLGSTSERYDFASGLPNSLAFAVLRELHFDDHRFIETVATHKGASVRHFESAQDAIEWLTQWPNKSDKA